MAFRQVPAFEETDLPVTDGQRRGRRKAREEIKRHNQPDEENPSAQQRAHGGARHKTRDHAGNDGTQGQRKIACDQQRKPDQADDRQAAFIGAELQTEAFRAQVSPLARRLEEHPQRQAERQQDQRCDIGPEGLG